MFRRLTAENVTRIHEFSAVKTASGFSFMSSRGFLAATGASP
jgi:hypothetical protein